jgi:hypothetical protein
MVLGASLGPAPSPQAVTTLQILLAIQGGYSNASGRWALEPLKNHHLGLPWVLKLESQTALTCEHPGNDDDYGWQLREIKWRAK